jgi:hypothetical protein
LRTSNLDSTGLNLQAIQHIVQLSRSGIQFVPFWRLRQIRTECRPSEQKKRGDWMEEQVRKSRNSFPFPTPPKPRISNRKKRKAFRRKHVHFYGATEAAWESNWIGTSPQRLHFGR